MALPVLETWAKTLETTATGAFTATKPSGVATNDLLVIVAGWDFSSSSTTPKFVDDLTGWNFMGTEGNTTSDSYIGAYWRIATGSEGATEEVNVFDAGFGWTYYLRFSGVDTTTPINQSNFSVQGGNSTSHAILGVTTDVDDCLPLYFLSFHGGDGDPFSPSSGWSEIDEGEIASSVGSHCFGDKDSGQPTAGATGTVTVTSTASDGSAFVQFAVAPAAAGGNEPLFYHHQRMLIRCS